MAADSQLALARPPRMSLAVPKAARQMVPAFLQKLYQMVNDDKNRDLITWSDAGDSFFVLDHERFAREVLGRWFKHQRFSSFVRQLNMYGFHKIPHLQQGVLRSDSDTEYWNFTHPNFRRDQPDLLCLIQRKKQSAALAQDGAIDIRDPNTSAPSTAPAITNAPRSPSPAISLTHGQLLDMHSIIQGITAIKRHQTTISSELTELKQSNQYLYSESRVVRTKLQNQQELIDRILKFLAGVFGSSHSSAAGGGHRGRRNASSDELDALMRGSDANKAVIPTRRRGAGGRLMIEAAKSGEGSGKPGIVELEDLREGIDEDDMPLSENNLNSNYAVETPISVPSPSPSELTASAVGTIGETRDRPDSAAITTNHTPNAPSQPPATSQSDLNTAPTATHLDLDRALTPTTNHHNNDTFEINQPWANILGGRNGITNDQLSQLLAVLAQSGSPNGNVSNTNPGVGGFDESLSGFDHHTATGQNEELGFNGGGAYGGQGAVQPGQPSSSSTSSNGGNQLTWPPPFSPSPGGFDFASLLQNLSPPGSAGLPPLPSASTSSFPQQQQQGLSPYGLLENSLPAHDEGLITLDSSAFNHDNNNNSNNSNNNDTLTFGGAEVPPLSPRLERQFQSTQEVQKEVDDMERQVNQWIEQLGPIFGNVVGGKPGSGSEEGTLGVSPESTAITGLGSTGQTAASIPQNGNGIGDLDFDSFLNISGAGTHGGVGVSGVDEDDEDDDGFGEEDEEEEGDAGEGQLGRVNGNGVKAAVAPTTTNTATTTAAAGKKRKSDMMMMVDENPIGEGLEGKVKRRKD